MILKIMNEEGTQYKEVSHQLYTHTWKQYCEVYSERLLEGDSVDGDNSPELVIIYNYTDGGGGNLHVFRGTSIYIMNADGRTIDSYNF